MQGVGAKDFNGAMMGAAWQGSIEIIKLCRSWGATEFDGAMRWAALEGRVEVVMQGVGSERL